MVFAMIAREFPCGDSRNLSLENSNTIKCTSTDLVNADEVVFSFERLRAQVFAVNRSLYRGVSLGADKNVRINFPRERFDAGCGVDHVANGCVVHFFQGAYVADHRLTGMDADADAERLAAVLN